jgi:glycosyltransferase involved in cell wall biosynthesis
MDDASWFSRDKAFELVGMAANDTGLGANLWMSERALSAAGIRARIRDSERGLPVTEGRSTPSGPAPDFRRKAVLVHLNADVVPQVLCHPLFDRHPDLYAIAFLLWELEVLPESHRLALDLVDEVWCPSEFLTDVYRRHTAKPVLTMKKGVEIPDVAPMPKSAMGVPAGAFTFLISFDFHSSVERKNPLAAVRAFQRAFAGEGDGDVRLVIKTTEVVRGHWGDPARQWDAIAAAAERDPRIQIIADKMPFTDFLAMIRGADCLVSSHRAEGFGYLPAYGLIYERPVIATDYSGSSDFITPETAFPVRWTPRDVEPHEAIFPVPGAFWADVDVDAMAEAMRRVHDQRDDAAGRARAGRRLMAETYSIRAQGARYLDRLREIGIIA